MKSRLATLVLLAAAAWAIFHYARLQDAHRRPPEVGGLLFPGLEVRAVDFVGMTFRGGHPLELERDDNGYWVITYPTEEEAQQEYVNVLLDNLARAKVIPIESMGAPIRAEDVGLEPPQFRIAFGRGEQRTTIFIGEFAPLKEGIYARIHGSDEILLVTANLRTMVEQFRNQDYVDKHLLRGLRGPVTSIRVVRPDGLLFDAVRAGDSWSLRGPVVGLADGQRMQQLTRVLSMSQQNWVAGVTDRDFTEQELRSLGFPTRAMAEQGDYGESTMIEMGTDGQAPVRAFLQRGWQDADNDIHALRGDFKKLLVVERNEFSLLRNDTDFFRDRMLLPPVRERARRVRIEVQGAATLDMARDARGAWTFDAPAHLAGTAVDSERVDGRSLLGEFLGRIDGLRAHDFVSEPPAGPSDAHILVAWDWAGSERTDRIDLYDLGAPTQDAIRARSTHRPGEGFVLADDVRALLDPQWGDRLRTLSPLRIDASRWGRFVVRGPGLPAPLAIERDDAATPWRGDDAWGRVLEIALGIERGLRGYGWRALPEGASHPWRLEFLDFEGALLASLAIRLPGPGEEPEALGVPVTLALWDGAPDHELEVPLAIHDALVRLHETPRRR